jgi:hypothetical protein
VQRREFAGGGVNREDNDVNTLNRASLLERVARVAILGDLFAILRLEVVIVAAEAAWGIDHALTGEVNVFELKLPDDGVVGRFDGRGQDASCRPDRSVFLHPNLGFLMPVSTLQPERQHPSRSFLRQLGAPGKIVFSARDILP